MLRTLLFDRRVTDFLAAHPDGTVVEIGTGPNTRYERVDNGRVTWFALDLPDAIALLRGHRAADDDRGLGGGRDMGRRGGLSNRRAVPLRGGGRAALHEPDVRRVVDLHSGRIPGSLLALDTAGPGFFDTREQHDALGKVAARMHWYSPDPAGPAA